MEAQYWILQEIRKGQEKHQYVSEQNFVQYNMNVERRLVFNQGIVRNLPLATMCHISKSLSYCY
jgi:hypothetical protein